MKACEANPIDKDNRLQKIRFDVATQFNNKLSGKLNNNQGQKHLYLRLSELNERRTAVQPIQEVRAWYDEETQKFKFPRFEFMSDQTKI